MVVLVEQTIRSVRSQSRSGYRLRTAKSGCATQFRPRTGDQGSGRTLGVNFCKRYHAPGWLVATWKATRSARTLMGSSRSLTEGELSGSDCWDWGEADVSR